MFHRADVNGNALRPFEPRLARYDVAVPAGAVGPLEIDLRVRFRFFPPRMLRALVAREAAHATPLVTEAMIDGALDVALAGPRSYDGGLRDFPFVHSGGRRAIGAPEIDAAIGELWQVWWGLLALGLVMTVLT